MPQLSEMAYKHLAHSELTVADPLAQISNMPLPSEMPATHPAHKMLTIADSLAHMSVTPLPRHCLGIGVTDI